MREQGQSRGEATGLSLPDERHARVPGGADIERHGLLAPGRSRCALDQAIREVGLAGLEHPEGTQNLIRAVDDDLYLPSWNPHVWNPYVWNLDVWNLDALKRISQCSLSARRL